MLHSSSVPHAADPNAIAQRLIQSAHTRDGLPEMAVGLTFLLVSGLLYLQVALPRKSIGFIAAVVACALFVPLLIFGLPWILKWVRRRYLVERVGYVQFKPVSRKLIGLSILIGAVAALALLGIVTGRLPEPSDRWLLAGTGLFGGALGALCGRLPRFAIAGVIMAATGVLVGFSGVPLQTGFAILYGVQGVVSTVAGGIVFLRFIRQPIETGE
jgi:hypothetical protein